MELSKEQVLEKRIEQEQEMESSNEIVKFVFDSLPENEKCEPLDFLSFLKLVLHEYRLREEES